MKKLIALLLMFLPLHAFAMNVAGLDLPEHARVQSRKLVLNGAGIRTKLFFKVYVAALYLEEKKTTAADVLADVRVKRIELHMMRTVDGDDFKDALNKGINANTTPEEHAALDTRLSRLSGVFREVGSVSEGDIITLDYSPRAGTVVSVNGKVHERINGMDFFRALLKIWLGDKPVSEDLKKGLLGG